jgi:hypothetical protein
MNTSTQPRPSGDVRERSELPLVMLAEDVARALGLKSASAARRAILDGECGPYLRRGRRLLVRREAFLDALRKREVQPDESRPRGAPRPAWGTGMVERTRPRRR